MAIADIIVDITIFGDASDIGDEQCAGGNNSTGRSINPAILRIIKSIRLLRLVRSLRLAKVHKKSLSFKQCLFIKNS